MNRSSTILLVDNDVGAAARLIVGLQDQGFRVLHATDGRQGLQYARAARPDLVLLAADPSTSRRGELVEPSGQGLPRLDGLAVCRTLRQESVVPIIMIGAGDRERERVRGLELGADDYVVKPFSFQELIARVRALLRRRELDRRQLCPPRGRIAAGDIVLDRAARQVWRAGRRLDLRRREFELLCALMENAGHALPRHDLLDQVWGENWVGDPRTVDVHIRWLRKKVEDEPSAPRYIKTVHGYGYRFVAPAAAA